MEATAERAMRTNHRFCCMMYSKELRALLLNAAKEFQRDEKEFMKITSRGYCFVYGDTKEKSGKCCFPEKDISGCNVFAGAKVTVPDSCADGSASCG